MIPFGRSYKKGAEKSYFLMMRRPPQSTQAKTPLPYMPFWR
eukprot:COSAG05_NODE_14931_length_383_cov_0.683099_1_plen_40_part_10